MGRKAALSYEQVKAVVNAFRAEGAKPTIDKVWEALDKAGSKGTIHRLVKQCLAESEQAQQTPESLRLLPHDVQQVILAFADRAASAARDSIANELLECTQGAETLASDNERRAAEVEELRGELALLASDKAAAEGRAEQLANELAAARGQVEAERAAAEQARTTLARMEMRLEPIGRLEEELRSATTERDAQREARVEAERAVAVLGSQRREHEERISELKSELAIARDASARGEQKIADLTEGLERERQARADAERDLAVLVAVQAGRPQNGPKTRGVARQGALWSQDSEPPKSAPSGDGATLGSDRTANLTEHQ